MKRLLALDQATAETGFSIWEDGKLVKWGKKKIEGETIERISQVRAWLISMVEALSADADLEVVLEGIQLQKDVDMFRTLAWLQGTLLVTLHDLNVKRVRVFFSTEWKKTCGVKGAGRTEQKRNAQKYVAETFGIKATQDECDAICLGKHAISEDDKVINWD